MALAIDVINMCGHCNEMHCQLQPKKTKVRLYQAYIYSSKDVLPTLTIRSALVLRIIKNLKSKKEVGIGYTYKK